MDAFWFIAGALAVSVLLLLAVKGPKRNWWQWVLIVLFEAWCVFSLDLALTTYAEGNSKGGTILLVAGIVLSLVFFAVLRALLALNPAKGSAQAKGGTKAKTQPA